MAIATTGIENDPQAHEALKAAHEAGYRFPEGFHGFSAMASVSKQAPDGGTIDATGRIVVAGPGSVTVGGCASDELQEWLVGELRSMAGHRWPTPYANADGKHALTRREEAGHPLGEYIKVQDDRFDSAYRVRDGRIAQVTRTMGPVTFTITIQQHQQTPDERVLPHHFTVNYWKEGRLFRSDMYADAYAEVDGVLVPEARQVVTADDDGFTTRRLEMTDVSLLTEPVDAHDAGEERTATRAG